MEDTWRRLEGRRRVRSEYLFPWLPPVVLGWLFSSTKASVQHLSPHSSFSPPFPSPPSDPGGNSSHDQPYQSYRNPVTVFLPLLTSLYIISLLHFPPVTQLECALCSYQTLTNSLPMCHPHLPPPFTGWHHTLTDHENHTLKMTQNPSAWDPDYHRGVENRFSFPFILPLCCWKYYTWAKNKHIAYTPEIWEISLSQQLVLLGRIQPTCSVWHSWRFCAPGNTSCAYLPWRCILLLIVFHLLQ